MTDTISIYSTAGASTFWAPPGRLVAGLALGRDAEADADGGDDADADGDDGGLLEVTHGAGDLIHRFLFPSLLMMYLNELLTQQCFVTRL